MEFQANGGCSLARYCWWNWAERLRSLERLLDLDVGWLLPGQGHRHRFASGEWRQALQQTLTWVQREP